MSNLIIEKLLAKAKRTDIPDFAPGDTIRVHVKIKEGDKERLQAFEGVVIARTRGPQASFTVRKISFGQGVERIFPLNSRVIEKLAWALGAHLVAGVDEVGRGSLFGPVVAAAVVLDPAYRIRGLRDSKLLFPEKRQVLAERIRHHTIAWSIAAVDAARIDQINIYQASRVAMREAVLGLQPGPDHLLIDALRLDCDLPQRPIIHGDAL